MDGNATWATVHNCSQIEGYREGMKNLVRISKACRDFHIKYITFYAFSTENWKRPEEWIQSFMNLAVEFFETDPSVEELINSDAKLTLIGDVTKLDERLQKILIGLVEKTQNHNGINVCVAVSYGSRDEIVRAVEKMRLNNIPITEQNISASLDTKDFPDPDMIIRTSGKQRLSNFLLWQASYSELYFSEALWPDFGPGDLKLAMDDYYKRMRTYGK